MVPSNSYSSKPTQTNVHICPSMISTVIFDFFVVVVVDIMVVVVVVMNCAAGRGDSRSISAVKSAALSTSQFHQEVNDQSLMVLH